MNQYRCETCTHFDCEYASKPRRSRHMAQGFFIKKGCASHSDFQSERDKALDEIDEFSCENCKDYHTSECPQWCSHSVNACTDHSKMAELRQQAGEQ
jgi:hypothetical protein